MLLTVDEVLTPKPAAHHFWELRTARIVTAEGYRYLSSVGETFIQHLLLVVLLARYSLYRWWIIPRLRY